MLGKSECRARPDCAGFGFSPGAHPPGGFDCLRFRRRGDAWLALVRVTETEFPGDGGLGIEARATLTGTMNCARDEVGIGDLDGCAAERLGLAYLIITHRLPEVRHVSDRLAIMYLGRFVEQHSTVGCHSPLG